MKPSKKKMQAFYDKILNDPKVQKLTALQMRDYMVFGETGDLLIKHEDGEVVYWYKGPMDDDYYKVV